MATILKLRETAFGYLRTEIPQHHSPDIDEETATAQDPNVHRGADVYGTVVATVTAFPESAYPELRPPWYQGCATTGCNKSVKPGSEHIPCSSCKHTNGRGATVPKYKLQVHLTDATATMQLTAFCDVGAKIVGCPASELYRMAIEEGNMSDYSETLQNALYQRCTFQVRLYAERFRKKQREKRVKKKRKHNNDNATDNTIQDEDEKEERKSFVSDPHAPVIYDKRIRGTISSVTKFDYKKFNEERKKRQEAESKKSAAATTKITPAPPSKA